MADDSGYAGLVERLRTGVTTEPGCSHPMWIDVEKADASMAEAATAIADLEARLQKAEASLRESEYCIAGWKDDHAIEKARADALAKLLKSALYHVESEGDGTLGAVIRHALADNPAGQTAKGGGK